MDIVFGNIDVLLTNNKREISENVKNQIEKINSKTALRRDMAQVVYFIINDKEIPDKIKIELIRKLQDMYNKAQQKLAKKKNIQEEPDDRVKNQQIDIVTRVGLAKQTNKNGNLLKFFNIHVESPKYPISAIDQVNSFLSDLTDEFEILMKPEDAEKLLIERAQYNIETNAKIVPNNIQKGKEPNDDKKNSAAPDLSDVADAERESNISSTDVSSGGKKRKTRKNRKNKGGSKLSHSQKGKLRDTLETRRKGTPYPRPRTTPMTLSERGSKLLNKYLFFNDAKDSRAYDTLKKIENFPTKEKDIENRTLTNDFVQQAKEDPFAKEFASLAKKDKHGLDNLSPEEQELFNNLSYDEQDLFTEKATSIAEKKAFIEKIKKHAVAKKKAKEFDKRKKELRKRFEKAPSLTAIQVAEEQKLYDNKRTYTPNELKYRTQTISEPVQKEIDPILEQRRNETVEAEIEAQLEARRVAAEEAAKKAVEAVEKYNREKEEQEQYDRLGGKKRKTKKNKKKNQKRKTSKRKQKQK